MLRRRDRAVVGVRGFIRNEGKADTAASRSNERLSPDEIARIVNDPSTFHAGFAPKRHYKR